MTLMDIQSLKVQLLQHRAALRAQRAALRGGDRGRVQASAEHFSGHEDPTAQQNTERELEFALDARETEELDAIEAALERMDAGTYGSCSDCGQPIARARLQATPEVARCIGCQKQREGAAHSG